MLFSSITFIFYFLPILLIIYFLVRKHTNLSNGVLLFASLVFYAWGETTFVFVMLFSICINYVMGRVIDRNSSQRQLWLIIGVCLNLGILIYFKYIGFFVASIIKLFQFTLTVPDVHLPLGISFFTFQAITYLVDIYRKKIQVQKNPFKLALYISLFPQLIAGPIVCYRDIEDQLSTRNISSSDFSEGVQRFMIGFSKKVMIANTFGLVADDIFSMQVGGLSRVLVIIAVVAYTIQIYYDFSGYSDMAIGLGRMFGFRFLENFNYPYTARSIQEFWRRWHISLSTFFKDYLYIPLGGSRKGRFYTYFNLIIVFALCGLWHGAALNFIAWGLYFGVFLILERLFLKRVLDLLPRFIAWGYAMAVVMMGWLLFRAESLAHFKTLLNALFSTTLNHSYLKYSTDPFLSVMLIIAIVGATPLFKNRLLQSTRKGIQLFTTVYLMTVFLIAISFLAAGTYNPFIYFRF